MTIRLDELLRCIATALDAVEIDLLGASTNHGKRIATLCLAMGRHLGMANGELLALSSGALLHDSALTEYILSERPGPGQKHNMQLHCAMGQRNVDALPCPAAVDGFVLYHHEWADGSGPFGKKEGEYPLGAALVAIADMLDVSVHLQKLPTEELPALRESILARRGTQFTRQAADAMLAVLDAEMLASLRDDAIAATISAATPAWNIAIEGREMMNIADMLAHIIDYKSTFTRRHSVQIARKAYWLARRHYHMDEELSAQVYLAASLHDLGKLFVPTEILEKTGKLTNKEFETIQKHVWWTKELLREVSGLENVCRWASQHHEKLDGSGYCDGLLAAEQSQISRMLACIDIYQAVTEERPYHPGRNHQEGMFILWEMVSLGKLDKDIVAALEEEMWQFPGGDAPAPAPASAGEPTSACGAQS